MKRGFLVFCLQAFCLFLSPAVAQEAGCMVTEAELTELESILMGLQKNRQMQQSQVLSLQERLKAAHSKAKSLQERLQKAAVQAKNLTDQLQTERTALTDLKKSYNAYERETAQALHAKQREIEKLHEKVHRRTIALIILASLVTVGVLLTVAKGYVKGTLRLFPP